jgi:hypothetical protein
MDIKSYALINKQEDNTIKNINEKNSISLIKLVIFDLKIKIQVTILKRKIKTLNK